MENWEGQKWAKLSLQIIYNAQKGGFSVFISIVHIRFLVVPFYFQITIEFDWFWLESNTLENACLEKF